MSGPGSRPRAAAVVELLPLLMVTVLVGASVGYVAGTAASKPTVDGQRQSATVPPIATFEFSPDSPAVGEAVTFDASGSTDPDGQIVQYDWDFDGDGEVDVSGSTPVVTHAFSSGGHRVITLIATDDDGNRDRISTTITVTARGSPTARFEASPPNPLVDQTVTFDASGSTDPDGRIVRYAWDFDGDGQNDAIGRTVRHAFQTRGDRIVSLTVTDDDGNRDQTGVLVPVRESIPPPQVRIDYSPRNPIAGEDITFEAVSTDQDGQITEYHWSFGDGSDATGPVVRHTYDTPGTYVVTLRATNGNTLRVSTPLVVAPGSVPTPSATPTSSPALTPSPTPAPAPPGEGSPLSLTMIVSGVILIALLVETYRILRRLVSRRGE